MVHRELEDQVVERLGGDAGLHGVDEQVERLGGQPAGLAHALEGLGAVQLDLAAPAAGALSRFDERHARSGSA